MVIHCDQCGEAVSQNSVRECFTSQWCRPCYGDIRDEYSDHKGSVTE